MHVPLLLADLAPDLAAPVEPAAALPGGHLPGRVVPPPAAHQGAARGPFRVLQAAAAPGAQGAFRIRKGRKKKLEYANRD